MAEGPKFIPFTELPEESCITFTDALPAFVDQRAIGYNLDLSQRFCETIGLCRAEIIGLATGKTTRQELLIGGFTSLGNAIPTAARVDRYPYAQWMNVIKAEVVNGNGQVHHHFQAELALNLDELVQSIMLDNVERGVRNQSVWAERLDGLLKASYHALVASTSNAFDFRKKGQVSSLFKNNRLVGLT